MSATHHQWQSPWRLKCLPLLVVLLTSLAAVVVVSLPAELMVKVNEKNEPANDLLQRALKPRTLVLLDGVDDADYTEFLSLLIGKHFLCL